MSQLLGRSGAVTVSGSVEDRSSFDEKIVGPCGKVVQYISWTDANKTKKIKEDIISRDARLKISSIITNSYNGDGILSQQIQEVYTRDAAGSVISVTRTKLL